MASVEELEQLRAATNAVFQFLLDECGLPAGILNYEPESLLVVEGIINRMWPAPARAQMYSTLLPIGFYLGEVLVKHLGGTWHTPDFNVTAWTVQIPFTHEGEEVTMALSPMLRAKKFMKDRTDSLHVMFETANLMKLGMLPQAKGEGEEGWSDWTGVGPNPQMQFRMKTVKRSDPAATAEPTPQTEEPKPDE